MLYICVHEEIRVHCDQRSLTDQASFNFSKLSLLHLSISNALLANGLTVLIIVIPTSAKLLDFNNVLPQL